jgi:hypothetical protein
MTLILLSQIVPTEPVAILPTTGILIGGAMTATTLGCELPNCLASSDHAIWHHAPSE